MSTVRKVLLRPGIYQAPQGELRATRKRVERWAETFRRMKALGIKIPCAWGHQPEAEPADASQRAERQYYLSRLNAGYLDDMAVDDQGNLSAVLDVPGCELDDKGNLVAWTRLPDGREVKTAVAEVSAAIKDWTDGQGRTWPDSIIHVALTPLPVVAGQEGFMALSTAGGKGPIYLSLTQLSGEGDMAEENDKPGTEGGEGEGGGNKHFKEGLEILKRHGISLPDDTTSGNFWERLCVAGAVLDGAEGGEGEMDETEPDGDEDGVSYSGEEGGDLTQEQRPVMMSLASARTPAEKKLLAKHQDEHKARQAKRIDGLVKRGMPVARANKLRDSLSSYTLSLNSETGDVVPKDIDKELEVWDQALPRKKFREAFLSTTTQPEPRPQLGETVDPKEIQERAARVSRKK